jgi:hypothetical protein
MGGAGRSTVGWGLGVFALCLAAYLASPVREVKDSKYALVLSQSLLERGSFRLDDYFVKPHDRWPTHLEQHGGRSYYYFPPGTSLLSLPFVAAWNAAGVAAVRAGGRYDGAAETRMQASIAALVAAALCAVAFATARLLLPVGPSLAVAGGAAFGSPIWSTTSRGLWSDTWGTLLVGCAVWLLLRLDRGEGRARPALLATLLAWAWFVRPTNAVAAALVTLYLGLARRDLVARFAAVGALWLSAFVLYSWWHFGAWLPAYYRAGRLAFDAFGTSLAANLVSPSRGLLVYVPTVAFVAAALWRGRRHWPQPRLVRLSLAAVTLHVVAVAGYWQWWAGHSYGARFGAGALPWLILLAACALASLARTPGGGRRLRAAGVLLLAASVCVNAPGALSAASERWNLEPVDVDDDPGRVFRWRDPQFLAWWLRSPAAPAGRSAAASAAQTIPSTRK